MNVTQHFSMAFLYRLTSGVKNKHNFSDFISNILTLISEYYPPLQLNNLRFLLPNMLLYKSASFTASCEPFTGITLQEFWPLQINLS